MPRHTFPSVSSNSLLLPRDGSSAEWASCGGEGATLDMIGLGLSMGRVSDASSTETETLWVAYERHVKT